MNIFLCLINYSYRNIFGSGDNHILCHNKIMKYGFKINAYVIQILKEKDINGIIPVLYLIEEKHERLRHPA